MRERVALIAQYTANDRTRFDGSRMVQDAVVRKLQTLTESNQRLSSTLCLNASARRAFGPATQLCKQEVKQWLTQLNGLA